MAAMRATLRARAQRAVIQRRRMTDYGIGNGAEVLYAKPVTKDVNGYCRNARSCATVCTWQKRFDVRYATWWKSGAIATNTVVCARAATRCASVAMDNTTAWNAGKPATCV